MIVDPWGVVLAQAPDTECFITADLDLAAQKDVRTRIPSLDEPPTRHLRLAGGHDDAELEISVRFPPGPDVVEHARARRGPRLRAGLALRLARAVPDVWVTLAQVAASAPSASRSAPRCWCPGCATR